MNLRDLFLDQHAAVHSAAVGGNKMSSAERTFGGVTDEQMRVRPREDLNSLAWLLWHIARGEEVMVNQVLAGGSPVLDDGWKRRLGIGRPDVGIGMTSAEVSDLTRTIDLGALRAYRDAVGLRSRDVISGFTAEDWDGTVAADRVERTAAAGAFGVRTDTLSKMLPGRSRALVLSNSALFHAAGHMGEANTVRSAGGFGTGV